MDNQTNAATHENVLMGIVGAFVFSLAGGLVYFLLYLVGFLASISGVVGVFCAITGYRIFAKKESIKGVIISAVIALLVIVLAWYLCFAMDIQDAFKYWFEIGDIDYTISFSEAVSLVPTFLSDEPEIAAEYIKDLLFSIVFAIIGGFSCFRLSIACAKGVEKGLSLKKYTILFGKISAI